MTPPRDEAQALEAALAAGHIRPRYSYLTLRHPLEAGTESYCCMLELYHMERVTVGAVPRGALSDMGFRVLGQAELPGVSSPASSWWIT